MTDRDDDDDDPSWIFPNSPSAPILQMGGDAYWDLQTAAVAVAKVDDTSSVRAGDHLVDTCIDLWYNPHVQEPKRPWSSIPDFAAQRVA